MSRFVWVDAYGFAHTREVSTAATTLGELMRPADCSDLSGRRKRIRIASAAMDRDSEETTAPARPVRIRRDSGRA